MLATRGSIVNDADTTAYSGTLGARAHITNDYEVEVSSTYGHNYGSIVEYPSATSGQLYIDRQPKTSVLSLDAKLDGSLWQSLAGPVRFAVGGQYSKE